MTETTETTQAVSPEAARAFLAAPVFLPGVDAATAGELLAAFFTLAWEAEPVFADWKSVLYVAGVHAGLFPGVVTGDGWLADVDPRAPRIVPEVIAAAIRGMGQPAVDVDVDAGLLPAGGDL